MKKILLVIMCLILLVGCGKKKEEEFSGKITLDINPSIEIEVQEGNANMINPQDEEAWELVDRDSMEGKPLKEVFEAIVEKAKEKNLIQSGELFVILGVENTNSKKSVEDIFKEACVAKDVHVQLIVPEITEEAKHEAEGYKVSPAKAAYILELLKDNQELNFEDLSTKSAAELVEIKDTGMYCDSGFTLRSGQCERVVKEEKPQEGKTCPEGYEEIKGKCYLIGPTEHEPTCKKGSELKDDGKCVTTETVAATAKCSDGTYNSKTKKCEKLEYAGEGTKSCSGQNQDPKDIMMSNGKCSRGKPMIGDGCEGSDSVHDGWCYNPSGDYAANVSCPSGQTVKDGKCYKTTAVGDPTYSCSKGKLEGDKCTIETSKDPTLKVTCRKGLKSYKDRACIDYDITAEYIKGLVCSDNARLEGDKCVYYEVVAAKTK